MGAFIPVRQARDLPTVGGGWEQLNLDFKLRVDPQDHQELAKDVAAFANANGGVILVGAAQDAKTGALGTYRPLSLLDAGSVKDAYERAVRNLCRPNPVIDVVPIPHGEGAVVAVNVWPFSVGVVGVASEGECFRFPVRLGTQTIYLKPEQLPMFMNAEVRRVVALLDQIPSGSMVELSTPKALSAIKRGEIPPEFGFAKMNRVDALQNRLELAIRTHPRPPSVVATGPNNIATIRAKQIQTDGVVAIPLDGIASVWQMDEYRWRVHIKGEIAKVAGPNPDFIFIPFS